MTYNSIPDSWREVGKAVKKDLVDLIHDNLEDLNGRVTNVEGSVSTTIILNQKTLKERDNQPLGTILWSPLSLAQFQAEAADGGWVLCDGASCAGSDYATLMSRSVVPDIRGRFVRMKAHGTSTTINPDGDVATDTLQAHTNMSHTHTMNHGHSHTIAASGTFGSSTHTHVMSHIHQVGHRPSGTTYITGLKGQDTASTTFTTGDGAVMSSGDLDYTTGASSFSGILFVGLTSAQSWFSGGVLAPPSGSAGSTAATHVPSATTSVSNSGTVTDMTGNTGYTGDATESRPQNITENCFIKINRNYITVRTGYYLWRAPQALTINQVILSPVIQGTSGTLTIDIKKGTVSSQTTSIFTALPDMVYTDSTAQTGTLNATNSQLSAGDYIRVDVTTTQAKLEAFHLLIAAAPT